MSSSKMSKSIDELKQSFDASMMKISDIVNQNPDNFLEKSGSEQSEEIWMLILEVAPISILLSHLNKNIDNTVKRITNVEKDEKNRKEKIEYDDLSVLEAWKGEEPEDYSSILTPLYNYGFTENSQTSFLKRSLQSISNRRIVPSVDSRQPAAGKDHVPEMIPDPFILGKSREYNKTVILNVGGERHEISWMIVSQMPQTRLGKLARAQVHDEIMALVDYYSLIDNEYFFDRHPRSFQTILNYYTTGYLHIIDEMCIHAFSEDLKYWQIQDLWIESCCQNKYQTRKEVIEEAFRTEAENTKEETKDSWSGGCCGKYQQFIWDIMEKPDTSLAAKVVSMVSILFVLVSTVAMVINTLPDMQGPPDENGEPTENELLSMIESICIMWFTLEYLLRFFGAPKKCAFLKDVMNFVDVLAILPYYVSALVMETSNVGEESESFSDVKRIVSIFRIMRILRVFKIARHSTGLQSIAFTVRNSYKELFLLVLFMGVGVLVFSTLCFFAEKDVEDTPFTSIPAAFWWAIITMCTVGYGDMYPVTPMGMFIGTLCAISGVLAMALPIPIVVNNFAQFYNNNKLKQKQIARKREKERYMRDEEIRKRRFLDSIAQSKQN